MWHLFYAKHLRYPHLAGLTRLKIHSAPSCLSADSCLAGAPAKFSSPLWVLEWSSTEKPAKVTRSCSTPASLGIYLRSPNAKHSHEFHIPWRQPILRPNILVSGSIKEYIGSQSRFSPISLLFWPLSVKLADIS